MPRFKNPDPQNQTSRDGTQIGFRLTPNEEEALNRLVAHERKDLAAKGIPTALHGQLTTRSMLLRALIEREAKRLGLWPEQDSSAPEPQPTIPSTPVAPPVEVQPVPSPVVSSPVDPRQLEIPGANPRAKATEAPTPEPTKPKDKKGKAEPKPLDMEAVRKRLQVALESGKVTGTALGKAVGLNGSGQISQWRGGSNIPGRWLPALDAALTELGF